MARRPGPSAPPFARGFPAQAVPDEPGGDAGPAADAGASKVGVLGIEHAAVKASIPEKKD